VTDPADKPSGFLQTWLRVYGMKQILQISLSARRQGEKFLMN